MAYLVDFSIGRETFGMKNFPLKNRVRGGIRVIGGRVIGGSTVFVLCSCSCIELVLYNVR